jgi:hypothetical protein
METGRRPDSPGAQAAPAPPGKAHRGPTPAAPQSDSHFSTGLERAPTRPGAGSGERDDADPTDSGIALRVWAMVRRSKSGVGAPKKEGEITHEYEGPDVLSSLLGRAGSPYNADEVAERFQLAQGGGEDRSDLIPALFPDEPRFDSADDARRLYGNLFALWDRLASGLSVAEDAPAATPEPVAAEPVAPAKPSLPPRGAARGNQLPPAVIESVWKYVDALSDRERRRLRDRFEGSQPDLVAWLDAVPLPDEGTLAAHDLVFETWAMFDVAFGARVTAVEFRDLRALESEPPPLEASQPALAIYVGEALDLVAEEDPGFGAAQRAQVERLVATVADALADALASEEDA